jgi:hypothetical protein
MPDRLLRVVWTSRLPSNVQVALPGMPEIQLDRMALCAARIIEAIYPSTREHCSSNERYRVSEALRRALSQSGESQLWAEQLLP